MWRGSCAARPEARQAAAGVVLVGRESGLAGAARAEPRLGERAGPHVEVPPGPRG